VGIELGKARATVVATGAKEAIIRPRSSARSLPRVENGIFNKRELYAYSSGYRAVWLPA
jgi:hypothetical protein